ncbi:DNA recombination protein RmuC, partial [Arthrospira platensis SPKY1]|nr:DNA recombination protein RmuC [Arthrospira platensis SPKY1]
RETEREQQMAEQLRLLKENREQLRQEFENLSHQIFEAKGKAFTEQSRQSLELMLKPFREQLGEFKTRVEDIHHREVKQKAELSAELHQLKQLNQQMTEEAHQLSTALRG